MQNLKYPKKRILFNTLDVTMAGAYDKTAGAGLSPNVSQLIFKKDGFTLAKEIREIDEAIPIIFLTAKSQTADVVEGFTIGGNDYLKKPFSMEELIVRINNLLQRTQVQKTADIINLETNLSDKLGASVIISHNLNGSGILKINYNNLDQLDTILKKIE
jgi:DNA-binding response OmpR family regulator